MEAFSQSIPGESDNEGHQANAHMQNIDAFVSNVPAMQSFDVTDGIFVKTLDESSDFASDLSVSPENVPDPYEMQEHAFQAMQNFQQQQQQHHQHQQALLPQSLPAHMVSEEAHAGYKRSRQEDGIAIQQTVSNSRYHTPQLLLFLCHNYGQP